MDDPVVTENLVCMLTLASGELIKAPVQQRCNGVLDRKEGIAEKNPAWLATRLLCFIRRTEAIVAEDRLILSGVALVSVMKSSNLRNHYDTSARQRSDALVGASAIIASVRRVNQSNLLAGRDRISLCTPCFAIQNTALRYFKAASIIFFSRGCRHADEVSVMTGIPLLFTGEFEVVIMIGRCDRRDAWVGLSS